MRRHLPVAVGLLLTATLAVTACSSDSQAVDGASPGAGSQSTTATAGSVLPTVTGDFGEPPVLTFPSSGPPAELATQVLVEGDGRVVTAKDVVVAEYVGQVWGGAVFDSTYDTGTPIVTALADLVSGWAKGLAGQKVGSRVLLSVPPGDGYGTGGNKARGIAPTDTIVFVVDLVDAFGADAAGQADAVPDDAARDTAGPQVSGPPGGPATLTLPAGTPTPADVLTTVLYRGSGAPVAEGKVVGQSAGVDWTGTSIGSTWQTGTPKVFPVAPTDPTFAGLIGVPLGSRVLLQVPAGSGPAVALVIDLVAQPA
ncbi:MAG TPA: FKBP-type peptidyl-prolyl cis-trans isomerase [Cellulomonas sp.]|uniref:FKBP-type peptidyl-prolyl cis-trans isomerase n=1 Tax=Cellulomonas sp. TaxID=40001 RepID=UPI002E30191A|nr:FKBP-type peptidyl-prolyl cis-trans isomerase [Cellulomonas sp.]HEX5331734.1 FKBP-type peptidyl-prolyl cis-trans isomerase [Cellulomonas sp.]